VSMVEGGLDMMVRRRCRMYNVLAGTSGPPISHGSGRQWGAGQQA